MSVVDSATMIADLTKVMANVNQIDLATKPPCRVATTANITLSGVQTIDGVLLVASDRVLVKNQTTKADNGIYLVSATTWTRALDFASSAQVKGGVLIPVQEGNSTGFSFANSVFQLTTNDPIILGTTELVFALPALQSYYLVDTGSANLIAVTIPAVPALTSWTQMIGIRMAIYIAYNNTGATTLAVTGLSGTKMVKKAVTAGLIAGDLLATGIYEFIYDGDNVQMRLPEKGDQGIAGDGATKRYIATLAQVDSAPVPTVIYNTLSGAITWSRAGAGFLYGTLTGEFPSGKVSCRVTNTNPGTFNVFTFSRNNNNRVLLTVLDSTGNPVDGCFLDVEIKIYS